MKKVKKPRRPANIHVENEYGAVITFAVNKAPAEIQLRGMRRMHAWLTRAIAYLEAK